MRCKDCGKRLGKRTAYTMWIVQPVMISELTGAPPYVQDGPYCQQDAEKRAGESR